MTTSGHTVGELIEDARARLMGDRQERVNLLDDDYAPPSMGGESVLHLKYPVRGVQAGSRMTVGLTTFVVTTTAGDGKTFTCLPGLDGSPDQASLGGALVRIHPEFSTWRLFSEWNKEMLALCSPAAGLYGYGAFTAAPNYTSGTYALPESWQPKEPIRLLMTRYMKRGLTSWQRIAAEYQSDGYTVRIYGNQPDATIIEFVFAFPFLQAQALDEDPFDLGLRDSNLDIPGIGACMRLSTTMEARRNSLSAQGSPRRADEVPAGAHTGVSRMFAQQRQARIDDEVSRLQAEVPPWRGPIGVQPWGIVRSRS